ncbi:hypothetical protein BD410DRAFT_807206 [Rickenella mellea]|uniref:Uncharacterized protein n=1 Tax=Rickenella mellea TaxID=50990 RepID=A0A4Y7PQE4_9AGAM|nr:hypothetical protein BD410DRAFT_807206 [Rickenella mellea]
MGDTEMLHSRHEEASNYEELRTCSSARSAEYAKRQCILWRGSHMVDRFQTVSAANDTVVELSLETSKASHNAAAILGTGYRCPISICHRVAIQPSVLVPNLIDKNMSEAEQTNFDDLTRDLLSAADAVKQTAGNSIPKLLELGGAISKLLEVGDAWSEKLDNVEKELQIAQLKKMWAQGEVEQWKERFDRLAKISKVSMEKKQLAIAEWMPIVEDVEGSENPTSRSFIVEDVYEVRFMICSADETSRDDLNPTCQ